MQILSYGQKWIFPQCVRSKERKLASHHLDYFLNFSETFGDNLLLGAKKRDLERTQWLENPQRCLNVDFSRENSF